MKKENRLYSIEQTILELKPLLQEKFQVKEIGIFGSYLRGEEKKSSDLDLLVEFREIISLFQFLELEYFLSERLGVKVDLVMKDALKPRIKDKIIQETIYI